MTALKKLLMLKAATGGGVKKYGGIEVWQDNVVFTDGQGTIDAVDANPDFFLAVVVDTGTPDDKTYTVTSFGSDVVAPFRLYDDLTKSSVDYWTIWRSDVGPHQMWERTVASPGRYIVCPVRKDDAPNFYLRDGNGNYLIKGENVAVGFGGGFGASGEQEDNGK